MKIIGRLSFVAVGLLSGCVSVPLAPGADQVKITRNAADVTGCVAVGNIDGHIRGDLDPDFTGNQMRNQAVGLGGNVVFDTTVLGTASGVIYRCGAGKAAASAP